MKLKFSLSLLLFQSQTKEKTDQIIRGQNFDETNQFFKS